MEPNIELHKRIIAQRAEQLLKDAQRLGLVVSIDQKPLLPRAMGHYESVVAVRAARAPAEK